eukprot:gene13195-14544_t
MPAANCSIYNCNVSRSHKGVAIFKIPGEDDDFSAKWRSELLNIVTKDRVIDKNLRTQIEARRIHICELHFSPDQINVYRTRKTLKPGVLPTLRLPEKSIKTKSKQAKPRESAEKIKKKKEDIHQAFPITAPSTATYKSFYEFCVRANSLKLPDIWHIDQERTDYLKISKKDQIHELPTIEIYVDDSLGFTIRVFGWLLPDNHEIYLRYKRTLQNITLSNLIRLLESQVICGGIEKKTATKAGSKFLKHCATEKFILFPDECHNGPLTETEFYRSPTCEVLTNEAIENKCNKVKLALQEYRIENKALKQELETMKKEIEKKSLPVSDSLNGDFETIMSSADDANMPPFMKLFWQQQQKYLKTKKGGIRYHPLIIKYCLSLAAKSPAAYDDIRYDEKTNTGFLILPSRRRLRDYKNYIRPQQGFNKDVVKELCLKVKDFSDAERFVILIHDEMKIQENLVWDKHTGDLIGYVDLGNIELNCSTFKKVDEIASHVLVFLIRSVVNPMKFTLANFATKGATSIQLFPLFWKAVGICELKCNLKVVGVTSDGASPNRKMYRMHSYLTRDEDCNNVKVTYRTENIFATDKRYIYFFADPPHLMKTARNCLASSGEGSSGRLMWNGDHFLVWSHISQLVKEDLECGLHLLPKLTNEHIKLTPFSKMNVKLAVQVLSSSVAEVLKAFGSQKARGTAQFCFMFDQFFYCMNVRNTVEHQLKRKPFLKPYESLEDERFTWLADVFLKYFEDWLLSIENKQGEFSKDEKANMFLSQATHEGVMITVNSTVELVKFLLANGAKFVLTERFCQDPLENYFGRQRSMGCRKDNPSLRDFGFNDNTIRMSRIVKPIQGNCRGAGNSNEDETKVEGTENIPCRKAKRKRYSMK